MSRASGWCLSWTFSGTCGCKGKEGCGGYLWRCPEHGREGRLYFCWCLVGSGIGYAWMVVGY